MHSSNGSEKKDIPDRRQRGIFGCDCVGKCSSNIKHTETEFKPEENSETIEKANQNSDLQPSELCTIHPKNENCSTHGDEKCSFCDDTCAVKFCEDCCVSCCTACFSAIHSEKGSFKRHMINELRLKFDSICQIHPLPLAFFCKTCSVGICIDCLVKSGKDGESHRGHEINHLDTYVKKKKVSIVSWNSSLVMSYHGKQWKIIDLVLPSRFGILWICA